MLGGGVKANFVFVYTLWNGDGRYRCCSDAGGPCWGIKRPEAHLPADRQLCPCPGAAEAGAQLPGQKRRWGGLRIAAVSLSAWGIPAAAPPPRPMPTPADDLAQLLLDLTVPHYHRHLSGRLRSAATGWHYPKSRMAQLPLKVVRPGRPDTITNNSNASPLPPSLESRLPRLGSQRSQIVTSCRHDPDAQSRRSNSAWALGFLSAFGCCHKHRLPCTVCPCSCFLCPIGLRARASTCPSDQNPDPLALHPVRCCVPA